MSQPEPSSPAQPAASVPPAAVTLAMTDLRLDAALQLVARAGASLPPNADPQAWLQGLIDQLCELSSRDALTGLVNRRQFEMALEREVDRVARSGEPALVLALDIDHFKRVNDSHGHAAGDEVIRAVGRALQDSVRPMDTVARVGGEEFAIVLPNCAPAFGQTVAERIRRRVERTTIDIGLRQTLQVTLSVGGAFAPQWVRSSGKLWMERADQQLYRAKQEGRNRACLEMPPVSVVSAEEKGMLFALPAATEEVSPAEPVSPQHSDGSAS
jgi:diguanylate cyclase (GGDEF)-like protein